MSCLTAIALPLHVASDKHWMSQCFSHQRPSLPGSGRIQLPSPASQLRRKGQARKERVQFAVSSGVILPCGTWSFGHLVSRSASFCFRHAARTDPQMSGDRVQAPIDPPMGDPEIRQNSPRRFNTLGGYARVPGSWIVFEELAYPASRRRSASSRLTETSWLTPRSAMVTPNRRFMRAMVIGLCVMMTKRVSVDFAISSMRLQKRSTL